MARHDSFCGEPTGDWRQSDGEFKWYLSIHPATVSFMGSKGALVRNSHFEPTDPGQPLVAKRYPIEDDWGQVPLPTLFEMAALASNTFRAGYLEQQEQSPASLPAEELKIDTSGEGDVPREDDTLWFLQAGPEDESPSFRTVITAPDDMALRNYVKGGSANAIQPGFEFHPDVKQGSEILSRGKVYIVATQSSAKARAGKRVDDLTLPDGSVLTKNEWRARLHKRLGGYIDTFNASLQPGECCTALTVLRKQFAGMMAEAASNSRSDGSETLQTSAQNPST